jgi:hypothetical protein
VRTFAVIVALALLVSAPRRAQVLIAHEFPAVSFVRRGELNSGDSTPLRVDDLQRRRCQQMAQRRAADLQADKRPSMNVFG